MPGKAWASPHHVGTSRVHQPHSAQPPSGGTHPHTGSPHRLLVGSSLHLQLSPSRPLLTSCRSLSPGFWTSDTHLGRGPPRRVLGLLSATLLPLSLTILFHRVYKPMNIETVDCGVRNHIQGIVNLEIFLVLFALHYWLIRVKPYPGSVVYCRVAFKLPCCVDTTCLRLDVKVLAEIPL